MALPSVWTPEKTGDLMKLWQSGRTCTEIGKILGVNKNQVVGKAHRLKLPARPNARLAENAAFYNSVRERVRRGA